MLFRQAAYESATQALGEVLLDRPVRWDVLVYGLVLCVAAALAFVLLCSYSKTSEVRGHLVPQDGVSRVLAPLGGTVAEVAVGEGDLVQAGQKLAIVRSHRLSEDGKDVDQQVKSLLEVRRTGHGAEGGRARDLAQERTATLRERVDNLHRAVQQTQRQIVLQEARVALAEKTAATFLELRQQHFSSQVQVDQHKADLLEQQLRQEEIQHTKLSLDREFQLARSELREQELRAKSSESASLQSIAQIEQELAELRGRREAVLIAPRSGKVTAVMASTGQAINAGQPVMTLLPVNATLEAELYASTRAIGFVSEGMQVQLRYQAFPYQRFGFAQGTVREVARSAVRIDEATTPFFGAPAASSGEPVYRIRVRLERQTLRTKDSEVVLHPGSLVDASIQLERRRVIEWILEPFLSLRSVN